MSNTDALKRMLPAKALLPERWLRSAAWLRGPLTVAGLLLLANLLMWGAWVSPTARALSDQEARSQAVRERLQSLFAARKAAADLVTVAPAKKDLPQAIGRLSALARRSGAGILEIRFRPEETGSPYWERVSLQFSASGSYAAVRRFIAALEGGEEPFVIDSVSLERDRNSAQAVARLSVSVYARNDGS